MSEPTKVNDFARGFSGGKPDTLCGRGSRMDRTVNVRKVLPEWIERYGIKTLNDAGAGDLNWISTVNLGADYRGFDIFLRHNSVTQWDITRDALPAADAILCRHVLNHLSPEQVATVLGLFRQSAQYLIATTSNGPRNKVNAYGQFVDYDLRDFGLGEPLEQTDDCRGYLSLWRMEQT